MADASTLVVADEPSIVPNCCLYVLEDPTRDLGLEEVLHRETDFQLKTSTQPDAELNYGYSASAFWLRLDLHNPSPASQLRLLEVAYSALDYVTLYGMDGEGHWYKMATGDKYPFANRPLAHRNFVFPVTLPPEKLTRIYVRVESLGSMTIPIRLWQADAFYQNSQNVYALLFIYYGIVLALGLYNLMVYFSIRDKTYLYYVCFASSMLLGQITLNGTGYEYLWPESPVWANNAMVISWGLCGFFAAMFTCTFLDTAKTLPVGLHRAVLWIGWGWAFAGASFMFMSYRWSCILISVLGLAHSTIVVLAGLVSQRREHHGARFFLLAWVVLLVGTGLTGARNLAIVPTTLLTTYALQFGSALEMLLLSFALADRINRLQREKELAQDEALRAHHNALEAARKAEQELELRVRSRTRSLEEANVRLREQEEMLRRMAQQDPLTGLANRSLLEDRLKQALLHSDRRRGATAVLLIDLDNFKPINDTHGHAAGDQVLITVARRLQALVRVTDTVGRMGGDEFVVVLDDLQEGDDGTHVADKVVTSLAQEIVIGRISVCVSASCGLARFPRDGLTVEELMRAADRAMYIAKSRGRNGYATLDSVASNAAPNLSLVRNQG